MQNEEMNTSEEKDMPNNDSEMNINEELSESTDATSADEGQEPSESDIFKNQYEEINDKYLRLVAEFDNFRKRNAKEKIELVKTASEDVIKSLLEVLDDSERALQQIESSENIPEIKGGIQLVFHKLKSILQSKGLETMNAKDQEFNPDFHEAITEIPAPTEELKGKVVDEIIKGYTLHEKIIRHAKVVVGK